MQNYVFYLSVESVSVESSENSKECTSPKFHSTYQVDDMILNWHQHCCECYNPEIDPKVEPCCPKDKCDDCLQLEFDDEKGGYDMLCLKKKSTYPSDEAINLKSFWPVVTVDDTENLY